MMKIAKDGDFIIDNESSPMIARAKKAAPWPVAACAGETG